VDRGAAFAAADPPCCSWDRRRALLETAGGGGGDAAAKPACTFDKVDMNTQSFVGAAAALMPAGGYGCRCSPERQRAMQAYEWEPAACELPAWDAHAFCAALGNRTILWLGDSSGTQLAAAVHNYVAWGGAACGAQMECRLADTLTGKLYGVLNRGPAWTETVDAVRPDIVILGVGAHIKHTFGTPAAVEVLETVHAAEAARYANSRMKVVWRTSLAAGCLVEGDAIAPLAALPRDVPGHWAHINATQKIYNFQMMEHWDHAALAFWRDHPRVATLDLTPIWMRPDTMQGAGEVEPWNCIHQCVPGPLRVAARQLLLLLQTELKLPA